MEGRNSGLLVKLQRQHCQEVQEPVRYYISTKLIKLLPFCFNNHVQHY